MERGSSREYEYFYSDEEDEDEVEDNNGFDSGHEEFESMTADPQRSGGEDKCRIGHSP